MNSFIITAFAEGETAGSVGGMGTPVEMITSFLPLIIIVVLFYFLLIRPQRKRDKETKAMLSAMKVGDKVVTIGGICGKIIKIKDNFVFIETGNIGTEKEKSVLKVERDAVKSVEQKQTN